MSESKREQSGNLSVQRCNSVRLRSEACGIVNGFIDAHFLAGTAWYTFCNVQSAICRCSPVFRSWIGRELRNEKGHEKQEFASVVQIERRCCGSPILAIAIGLQGAVQQCYDQSD